MIVRFRRTINSGGVDKIELDAATVSFSITLSGPNSDNTLSVHLSDESLEAIENATQGNFVREDEFVVFVDEIRVDPIWETRGDEQIGTIPLKKGSENVEVLGSFLIYQVNIISHFMESQRFDWH